MFKTNKKKKRKKRNKLLKIQRGAEDDRDKIHPKKEKVRDGGRKEVMEGGAEVAGVETTEWKTRRGRRAIRCLSRRKCRSQSNYTAATFWFPDYFKDQS